MQKKLSKMEAKAGEQALQIVRIESGMGVVSGKLDTLITASQADAKTREDRKAAAALERRAAEAREERRESEERKERIASRRMILSIVVPTLAAIGGIIAALAK